MLIRIIVVLLLFSLGSKAQVEKAALTDSAQVWFKSFLGDNDSLKIRNAETLENQLAQFYSDPSNFSVSFDTLNYLGQLTSEDDQLRIITFNIPYQDETFRYYCLFVEKMEKEKAVKVHRLVDNGQPWVGLENKTISQNEWYGALYYRIITRKYKGETFYTLIGWDGNTRISNLKMVDVVQFDSGVPLFGAPMFIQKDEKTEQDIVQRRLIFEYAEDANMALNFQENENLIVMDHLAPENPKLEGQFQFYGPDFSYDALKFKKGKWHLIRDHGANNRGLNNHDPEAKPGDFED